MTSRTFSAAVIGLPCSVRLLLEGGRTALQSTRPIFLSAEQKTVDCGR